MTINIGPARIELATFRLSSGQSTDDLRAQNDPFRFNPLISENW